MHPKVNYMDKEMTLSVTETPMKEKWVTPQLSIIPINHVTFGLSIGTDDGVGGSSS